ncbi:MAG: manganese transporter [Chloroflexi bacterium]|nr:MAG: manganese transporter [Chloroflexota bacterium]
MKRMELILLMLLTLIGLAGCGNVGQGRAFAADEQRLKVVTTTGHIADAVQNVGGEHVAVVGLMGPGVDPHLYVASEGDVLLLAEADVIFYNGLFLEAQMEKVLERIGERKTAVPVAESIPKTRLIPSSTYTDEYDPHVWFDVELWMIVVATIRDTLIQADPTHAADYEANATAYLAKLQDLHEYVKSQAARVPEKQRVLITAHDAFSYFGRAYGFEVRGLQGISTASEASTADVQALADFIAERQIRALFIETSVPVRNVEAVKAAVAARGFEVTIGGSLFSDALGDPGTPEGTYIGVVRHNIDTIVTALLGE